MEQTDIKYQEGKNKIISEIKAASWPERETFYNSKIKDTVYAKDREVALVAIDKFRTDYGLPQYQFTEDMLIDVDFMTEAMKINQRVYVGLGEEHRRNIELAKAYVKITGTLSHVPLEIREDKKFVIEIMSEDGSLLDVLNVKQRKDKDIVLAAVINSPKAYQLSSKARAIREDRDIVKAYLSHESADYEIIPSKFRFDRELAVLSVISNNAFRYLQQEFKEDRDIVKIAVVKDGNNLGYAKKFKADIEIVLSAIENCGPAIQHATDIFRSDKDIALLSLNSSKEAFSALFHIDRELQCDYDVIEKAVNLDGCCLKFASNKLRDNYELAKQALTNDGEAYEYISDRLKQDKNLVLMAYSNTKGNNYQIYQLVENFFPEEMKALIKQFGNKDDCIEALKKVILKDKMELDFIVKDTDKSKAQELLTGIHLQGTQPVSRPAMRAKI